MRQAIINEVLKDKEYKAACSKIAKGTDLADDLYQEMMIVLLTIPEQKLVGIYEKKELRWYVVGMLTRMFYSATSEFNRKYRPERYTEEITDFNITIPDSYDFALDEAIASVKEELQKMKATRAGWYSANLFELIAEKGKPEVHRETGIPRSSIQRTAVMVREKLRKKIQPDK